MEEQLKISFSEKQVIEVGQKYTIDNMILRCIRICGSGVYLFQQVDELGNDIIKQSGSVISDPGRRIICKRVSELKIYENNINN